MTDEMILKKAIEKAVKGGYGKHLAKAWLKSITPNSREYFVLIFSHSFAKAFFEDTHVGWQLALTEMVLEENPIRYLKKFL